MAFPSYMADTPWFELTQLKGNAGSKRQHVHSCTVVRAKRFYGYYSSEDLFVKIYLYLSVFFLICCSYCIMVLSFLLWYSGCHVVELLDKILAIIHMMSLVLPIFFWYDSSTCC